MSRHTLKHLAAALGVGCVAAMLRTRVTLPTRGVADVVERFRTRGTRGARRVAASGRPAALGKPGLTAAPCPDQKWEESDATFEALPGAKASFGRYDGGVYRVEVPDKWNGELVLWAHGYVANAGAQGSRLRVGFPGTGQASPLRSHLITNGFAWAASSYRCNGYVPGRGLLDTMALTDLVTKQSGKAPTRVYLTGVSMGGHITILGLQEFPTAFAGGLAMCPAGPGEMDFLTSVREPPRS